MSSSWFRSRWARVRHDITWRRTISWILCFIHWTWKRANVSKHDGRPGFPGPDWMTSYLKRNNLSLKEATNLSSARYNATENPFVIFHYFDILEEAIEKLKIRDRPDLIWNCDESGLPHEPKKCQVISEKGQETLSPFFNYYHLWIVNYCNPYPRWLLSVGYHRQS